MSCDEEDSRHPQVDALLQPLIAACDATQADTIASHIISEETVPLVVRIIGAKLKRPSFDFRDVQEADELKEDVIVRLWSRLEQCRIDPCRHGIANWRGYVRATTQHACDEYLRQKHPRRHSLENKLRYLFANRPHLAIWQTEEGGRRCGREKWRNRDTPRESAALLSTDFTALGIELPEGRSAADLALLVDTVLNRVGQPVDLDDLVDLIATLWGVRDYDRTWVQDLETVLWTAESGSAIDIESKLSDRQQLQLVWAEILELPVRQRAALLLNMRDDAITLLPITGVASIRQIALALGRSPVNFAVLWKKLPLADAAIALELGVTRQQVINLRKSARARLARRLKSQGGNIAPR